MGSHPSSLIIHSSNAQVRERGFEPLKALSHQLAHRVSLEADPFDRFGTPSCNCGIVNLIKPGFYTFLRQPE